MSNVTVQNVPSFPYNNTDIVSPDVDSFIEQLMDLLPDGAAWPKDPNSNMWEILSVSQPSFVRLRMLINGVLTDAYPGTTTGLIPEWQQSLGLPDPCWGSITPTTEQARNQIIAKLINNGGQSITYITAYALQLGFVITITEQKGFQTNVSQTNLSWLDGNAGNAVFTWFVNSPLNTLIPFQTNMTTTNSPLQVINNNDILECELRAICPGHTNLIFVYN